MVLQACKSLGATDITVVDVMDKRLDLAKKLGACQSDQWCKKKIQLPFFVQKNYSEIMVWNSYLSAAGSVFTAQQAVQIVSSWR